MFTKGEKVIYLPENKVYDFGYVSSTEKAIIYEEGECNMQDAVAVDIGKLIKVSDKTNESLTPLEQQTNFETLKHIQNVQHYIFEVINKLLLRAENHDKSKLEKPEVEYFAKYTPLLRESIYGSPEYYEVLKKIQPALDHHYANNSHHPEAHEKGIDDMTLIDLIELLMDWKSASMRHTTGNVMRSIEINKSRFNISPQLVDILKNTIKELGLDKD